MSPGTETQELAHSSTDDSLVVYDDSSSPLITNPEETSSNHRTAPSQGVCRRLYISHFLSTWSSRMFEFGAVLFLASIFPATLLYASIYALVRSLAAIVLSSWLGSLVDRSNRLSVLRKSIVWQRVPVAGSCLCFVALLASKNSAVVLPLFSIAALLACIEKLASVVNTVAVERDWVIVVSDSLDLPRQELNASMRRIDLFCKLFAPVFISLVDSFSTRAAIWAVFCLNASSVLVEYLAIAQVYKAVPELARGRDSALDDNNVPSEPMNEGFLQRAVTYTKSALQPWREYVTSPACLPSFALSVLYLTVLSFGAQMVTYLLHTGFSSLEVSCMRIGAVVAELAGTWAAPLAMNKIGPVRSGLWFINYQFACLAASAAAFLFLDPSSRLVALCLILGVALSRLGLWGFDLAVQFLVQENTDEGTRARFSSTEMALQNIFELLSFASTIMFPLPEQFKYPVLISYSAVAVAAICFAVYVRRERGHLLHTSKCLGGDKLWSPSRTNRVGHRNRREASF
ncbi:hypothetical protein DTO164E3_4587 [Paecilomyces variotii]|nr:hypothetical protein DTO164E3_4587 [Paecilomyces variotii]KAJ9319850.1 hypothetical protein DTO027B3_9136 [Paecilomyces variotii]KAJ9330650.1 hypothetical protein DTO027B5_7554 [Paecilomyces variotii]KAJ9395056.1 hypothetical protein DTO282F9_8044 [Paecilomyces variotii]KAJ9409156.1 hypothetical protein DTO045G8_2924 [Paecilomyces variotii]